MTTPKRRRGRGSVQRRTPAGRPSGDRLGLGERLLIGVLGVLMAAVLVDYLLSHPLVLAGIVLAIGVSVLVAALLPRRYAGPGSPAGQPMRDGSR